MEVQEFAPRHLVAQLSYARIQPSVVDRRGALADELADVVHATSVSMDDTAAEVLTDESMKRYRIGILQLLAVVNVQSFDDDVATVRDFFRRGIELAGSPPLRRVVVHTSEVAAVPSFDELRDALGELLPDRKGLREAIGLPLSDLGWSFDFSDERWLVEVKIGPMREDELRKMFEAPKNVEFPPDSLLTDVKVVLRAPKKGEDPLDSWSSAFERNRRITRNMDAWLREMLV